MEGRDGRGLLVLTDEAARWYVDRFGRFFSSLFNQGLGAFFLFVASLTIGLILFRVAYFTYTNDRQVLTGFLETEIEPQSDVARGAVLSIVLQAARKPSVSEGLACSGAAIGDCAVATRILERTESLIELLNPPADERETPPNDPDKWQQDQATRLAAILPGMPNALSTFKLINEKNSNGADLATWDTVPCDSPKKEHEHRLLGDRFLLAKAICSGSPEMVTVQTVPAEVAGLLSGRYDEFVGKPIIPPFERKTPCGCADDQSKTALIAAEMSRIRQARIVGQIFDLAMQSIIPEMEVSKSRDLSDGPHLAAAYFLSVDSVLQYWGRDAKPKVEAFPPFRLWAARPYIYNMIRDGTDTTTTRAYIDFTGKGLVSTICTVIHAYPDRDKVLGAVCADFALSDQRIANLVEAVNALPIAKATAVVYSARGGGAWTVGLQYPDKDEVGIDKLKDWLESIPQKWTPENDNREIEVSPSGTLSYLVPLDVRSDGRSTGLVLHVSGLGPFGSRPVLFFGALLSFLVALAAYSTGAGRSKEIAKREQLLGRLRSLPMAVIQTDAGDNITAGNDRAEELIGASLPTFGLSQKSRDSWDLFDKEHIVFFRKGKSVPTNLIGVDHKEFELRNAEAIQAERASGRHSTYYVKVRHPLHHEWLKVTAGPIFQPHSELPRAVAWMTFRRADQSDIAGTFGVLETVKHPVNEKTPSDEIALIEEYNSKIIRYLEDAGKTRRSV